jgi:hypothetical protein
MKVEERARRGGRPPTTVVLLALAAVAAAVALTRVDLPDLLPSFSNPFGTDERDRTGPAVLRAIEDLSQYRAAGGNFQVVLDVEEDARLLPDFLRGERILFVAGGTVDAYVDFSHLDEGAIELSDGGEAVTVTLPSAQLTEPRVDPERSYVVTRQRGLLDRIGSVFSDNPSGERELYLRAEDQLTEAAREAGLTERAEANTRAMLEGMLRTLGYEEVAVRFERPPT